jgi:DNA-binding MarR family transcriptional regulator
VAKLAALGLIVRRGSAADKRVREATATAAGKAMTARIDRTRERIGRALFAAWDKRDVDDLVRLMRKFADAVSGMR